MQRKDETEWLFLSQIPYNKPVAGIGENIVSKLTGWYKTFHPANKNPNWLHHEEAAAYLKTAKRALFKLTSENKVVYAIRGIHTMFLIEKLEKYLLKGEVKTNAQIKSDNHILPHRKPFLNK